MTDLTESDARRLTTRIRPSGESGEQTLARIASGAFLSNFFYNIAALDDAALVEGLDERTSEFVLDRARVHPEMRPLLAEAAEYRRSHTKPPHTEPAHVYFIQADNGLIKIGCATNPKTRLASLQTGSPERLRLIGVSHDGGRDLEASLHAELAASRSHGEWFHPTTQVLDRIAQVSA